jgi:hypothetical protein
MAYSKQKISSAEAAELVSQAKAATPSKKVMEPLDLQRKQDMDPRDPRSKEEQWPCYGLHLEAKPKSNQHGQWVHCQTCALRLNYVPRHGAAGQTTKCENPTMVLRMLKETYTLTEGRLPTAELCHAVQAKIDAEETMNTMVAKVINSKPKPVNAKFQDESKVKNKPKTSPMASSASSWDMLTANPGQENPNMVDLETHLTQEEKAEIADMIQRRKSMVAPEDSSEML